MDMTYRFYSGLITLTINCLRELSDYTYWVEATKPVCKLITFIATYIKTWQNTFESTVFSQ